jgi:hypothetical protein
VPYYQSQIGERSGGGVLRSTRLRRGRASCPARRAAPSAAVLRASLAGREVSAPAAHQLLHWRSGGRPVLVNDVAGIGIFHRVPCDSDGHCVHLPSA